MKSPLTISEMRNLCGEWRRGVTATRRQTHVAGEKLFVDFAGDTMPVFDAITGEVRETKIFVAVLGASNYTYAEARFSEGLADWIGAHVNALAFLGGVPKAIVCDNLKAGVTTASRYEPGANFHTVYMAAEILLVECKACGHRSALDRSQAPIHQGNMAESPGQVQMRQPAMR